MCRNYPESLRRKFTERSFAAAGSFMEGAEGIRY